MEILLEIHADYIVVGPGNKPIARPAHVSRAQWLAAWGELRWRKLTPDVLLRLASMMTGRQLMTLADLKRLSAR